jgi:hypothetical protein
MHTIENYPREKEKAQGWEPMDGSPATVPWMEKGGNKWMLTILLLSSSTE